MGKGSWTTGQRPVTLPVPPDNGAALVEEDTREECPQCGKKYKDLQNHIARVHAPVPPSGYPYDLFQWMFDSIANTYGKKWGLGVREVTASNGKMFLKAKKYHEAQQP